MLLCELARTRRSWVLPRSNHYRNGTLHTSASGEHWQIQHDCSRWSIQQPHNHLQGYCDLQQMHHNDSPDFVLRYYRKQLIGLLAGTSCQSHLLLLLMPR